MSAGRRSRPAMRRRATARAATLVRRHRLSTRVWHWINALTVFVMLMSGLMIFNAHPAALLGPVRRQLRPGLAARSAAADGRGYLRVGEASIDTTGVLGARTVDGRVQRRAFPGWATIPSNYDLALSRRWHLTFAWVLRARDRRLRARRASSTATSAATCCRGRASSRPRHLWHDIRDHARLNFPKGEAARRYNVLQKLAYLGVLVVLIPLMILTGLTMSPGMDATWPWLLDLFGGRQIGALDPLHRAPG